MNTALIKVKAGERLRRNTALLNGRRPDSKQSYTLERLTSDLQSVNRDLDFAISEGSQFVFTSM